MKKLQWTTEKRKISDLIPAKYNPRKLSAEQAEQLKKSIDKFEVCDPIIININNIIIGGHQRIKILKQRGDVDVDVRVPSRELSENEEKELNLRLNKNLGEWDLDLLLNFDESMLKDIGFDSKELDKIFQLDDKIEEDDVPEERKETDIKPGDVFILGRHRVMCGDSTKNNDISKLMDGRKSSMIFTDPPYNVDYGASKNPRHKIRSIENDNLNHEDWKNFCTSLYCNFKEFNTGDIYMWGASGPEGMKMRLWLTEIGCHWSATIVWKKQQLVLSPANYQRMYEPCFYGWFEKSSFQGDRKQTEVWEINRPHDSKLHPTMKPIELCSKGILNSSSRDGIVLDFFLGSGSTLIACEQTNRICYGMEIDPIYVQVIIDRWENFTGQKVVKV